MKKSIKSSFDELQKCNVKKEKEEVNTQRNQAKQNCFAMKNVYQLTICLIPRKHCQYR